MNSARSRVCLLCALATLATGSACKGGEAAAGPEPRQESDRRSGSQAQAVTATEGEGAARAADSGARGEPAPLAGEAPVGSPAPAGAGNPEALEDWAAPRPVPAGNPGSPPPVALADLRFVPRSVQGIIRLDVAALAAGGPEAAEMMEFMFRAQQPFAWDLLSKASLRVGREIRTLLLLGRPGAGRPEPELVVAAMGPFSPLQLGESLRRLGARVELAPALPGEVATLFVWDQADVTAGSLEPHPDERHPGPVAIGLAERLILVGDAALVRDCLAARAGDGADLRGSTLADDLVTLSPRATLWAIASDAAEGTPSLIRGYIPGVKRLRFQSDVTAPGLSRGGAFVVWTELDTPERAAGLRTELLGLVAMAAEMTAKHPLGPTLAKLKQTLQLTVAGRTLRGTARL